MIIVGIMGVALMLSFVAGFAYVLLNDAGVLPDLRPPVRRWRMLARHFDEMHALEMAQVDRRANLRHVPVTGRCSCAKPNLTNQPLVERQRLREGWPHGSAQTLSRGDYEDFQRGLERGGHIVEWQAATIAQLQTRGPSFKGSYRGVDLFTEPD